VELTFVLEMIREFVRKGYTMTRHHLPNVSTLHRVAPFVFLLCAITHQVRAADIDIYGPAGAGGAANAVFLLDNTSNWSTTNQNWNAKDSWTLCSTGTEDEQTACQAIISEVYYPTGIGTKPWEDGFIANKDNVELTQGQVQLRAFKLVLNALVCANTINPIKVNLGLAMIGDTGSVLNNGHSTGFIRFAVQELVGPYAAAATNSCTKLIDDLDNIDSKITAPTFKAPANANYGSAMYEVFKYFGGYSNPVASATAPPTAGTPVSSSGYGAERFSKINSLDDPSAFTNSTSRLVYNSPISAATSCSGNYLVLVGNTYPNAEPASNGGPVVFNGINYTPPTLPAVTSDSTRLADEWAYFLANTDVSPEPGTQSIKTYAVNTYKDKPSSDQARLMKSMAAQGGVGPSGYLEVGGDLVGLVEAFKAVLTNIASVDSVFTATTLPVSTTTQGTYLNQIFVGMFKPDANGNPRWLGNLKQYKLGFTSGVLDLLDASSPAKSAVANGFFAPLAKSYWTEDSVFFTEKPDGTPKIASDSPDGKVVEKGGAAQMLRKSNLENASNRNVYTILPSASPAPGTELSATPFVASNVSTYFSSDTDWIKWIRGENNVASGLGMEEFTGYYLDGTTPTKLPVGGARPSMHGDILHSRPVALNYGTSGGVVVYYGTNDGLFHAVDGNVTGTKAGQELWSFIAPEFYSTGNNLFERLHEGEPFVQLPENDASGALRPSTSDYSAKSYGMDGSIGTFARYDSTGTSLLEAIIYPTMRRGGQTVYALDVTDKAKPKFKWKVTGGGEGDYAKLAQTWSIPKPILLSAASGNPSILLVMGGGYDPAEDALIGTGTAIDSTSRKGNAIFIINGRNGELIKQMDTDYSVPSDVSLADVSGDGIADRGYVADVRGNLYRFDFPTTGDLTDSATWSAVTAEKIATLNGRVFFPPDVIVTKKFVAVMVGTGDREKPLQSITSDNFFLIKDNVGSPRKDTDGKTKVLVKNDLTRVAKMSSNASPPLPTEVVSSVNDAEGCYLELATNGEKVVNAPLSIAGVTYFGTNRPTPVNANRCSADLGEAYAYQFPLFCGAPVAPVEIEGGGLAPNPVAGVVLIGEPGNEKKVNFLIGGGIGGSNFTPAQPQPVVSPKRTRLYWRIDNSNR
jgi:type IV pilus assembly protein PilY1